MTKQELEKYEEMQDAFQTRCEKVCRILRPLKDSYNYVYEFEIDGDDVCGHEAFLPYNPDDSCILY